MECIVCSIVDRKIEACILLETEGLIAFLDHAPINSGHVLLCPKQHYSAYDTLPDWLLDEINLVSRKVYHAINTCYAPQGISMMSNDGHFNELGHFHLHLFPRFEGDGFGWLVKNGEQLEQDALRRELVKLTHAVKYADSRKHRLNDC